MEPTDDSSSSNKSTHNHSNHDSSNNNNNSSQGNSYKKNNKDEPGHTPPSVSGRVDSFQVCCVIDLSLDPTGIYEWISICTYSNESTIILRCRITDLIACIC